MLDQAQDVGFVVEVVGVVGDAAAFVGFDAVLVDDPIEGGAVAQLVVEDLGRDAVQGEEVVLFEAGFVFAQAHFFDAVVQRQVRGFFML